MRWENIIVSVVIPVYNVEKYLRECIDSVLSQTYKYIQIILVDDGSADSSGAICDEYARSDSRIKVIHKKNGGLSDARNAGALQAEGRYLYFLDSDDSIVPDALKKLVSFATKTGADVVLFDSETVYDEDYSDPYRESFFRSQTYPLASGTDMLRRMTENGDYYACVPFMFFDTVFYKRNRLLFYKGIIHEDELFTPVALVKAKRVGHINEKLYIRRQRNGSIMAGRECFRGFQGLFVCTRELMKAIKHYPQASRERKALMLRTAEVANLAVIRYADLTDEDRRKASGQFCRLCRMIRKYDYLGSRKLRIKLAGMPAYIRYRSIKRILTEKPKG